MRGDQPERRLVSPIVIHCRIAAEPYQSRVKVLRRGRALAPVPVLEPHDVVQVRRRDLDDERVLDRRHAVHGARAEAERVAGRDLERLELAPDLAELEPRAPLLHEPRLVLDLVVLQAQRLAGADEEELADVVLGLGPDELPAPWLVDLARRYAYGESRSREPERLVGDALARADPEPVVEDVPVADHRARARRLRGCGARSPAPSSASSPTIEPTTLAPAPTLVRAPTTAFSTTPPAASVAPGAEHGEAAEPRALLDHRAGTDVDGRDELARSDGPSPSGRRA